MLEDFREFGRVLRGAGLFGHAERLERRGRLPEARVALLDALARVEGIRDGSFYSPAAVTTRLFAYMAMARIASEMRDSAETACYATKGLAGWSEFRLGVPEARRDRKVEVLADWESWARQFLAWWETQQVVQPTMKLEFVGHAETARSAGPLIRLFGRDGQVVAALRRALAGLSGKPLAVHAVPGIEPIDGCHLAVLRGTQSGVEQIGPRSFLWELDAPGWSRVVELLEPFESPDERDGFQFLSYGSEVTILISTDGHW